MPSISHEEEAASKAAVPSSTTLAQRATTTPAPARPTRADHLRLMRLMADVAALQAEPARQRQHLIDGLAHVLRTRSGWLFSVGNYRPGMPFNYRAQVLVSEPNPQWMEYITSLAVRVPVDHDPIGDAILHNPARRQVYAMGELLAAAREDPKYAIVMRMARDLDIRDGLVGAARIGPGGHDVVGFSLHCMPDQAPPGPRGLQLARQAVGEIARLAERGVLNIGPATTVVARLPPRLQQILLHLLDGHAIKRIAVDLNLSVHTVREHVQRLYGRFGVTTREEFMARFIDARPDEATAQEA